MSIKIVDDETGSEIAENTGIEVILVVAGAQRRRHYTSWDEVPWNRLVRKAQEDGQLQAVAARDMSLPTRPRPPR